MTSSIILTYLFPTDNNRCTAADDIQESMWDNIQLKMNADTAQAVK